MSECPVCMEPLRRRVVLECQHIFCFPCLKQLQARKKNECPLCRADSTVITNLKSRCPARGSDGISRVSKLRARPAPAPASAPAPAPASAPPPSIFGFCTYCEIIYHTAHVDAHTRCPIHRLCGGCAALPYLIGIGNMCIMCMFEELGMTRDAFCTMLNIDNNIPPPPANANANGGVSGSSSVIVVD